MVSLAGRFYNHSQMFLDLRTLWPSSPDARGLRSLDAKIGNVRLDRAISHLGCIFIQLERISRNCSSMSLIDSEGNPVEHLPSFHQVLQSSPNWRHTAMVALSFALGHLSFAPDDCPGLLSIACSGGHHRSVSVALLVGLALRELDVAEPWMLAPSYYGFLG